MPPKIEDLRIQWTKVVLPPVFLEEDLPITETASATIFNARTDISAILNGRDRACWSSSAPAPFTTPRPRASTPRCSDRPSRSSPPTCAS